MAMILSARLRDIWRSFWALPLIYMIAAAILFLLATAADRAGASAWLAHLPWPLSLSGDTALEAISSLITVIISLVALFFSITLIVMTMAASNLGVRLIDRWVSDISIRVTLSLLLGLLVYALLLQAAVDPAGPDARLPRLSLILLIVALVTSICWLAKAFDHLSRRIHVDTSIAELGTSLAADLKRLADQSAPDRDMPDWDGARAIAANGSGYVDALGIWFNSSFITGIHIS